jgi:hypothetical protein
VAVVDLHLAAPLLAVVAVSGDLLHDRLLQLAGHQSQALVKSLGWKPKKAPSW